MRPFTASRPHTTSGRNRPGTASAGRQAAYLPTQDVIVNERPMTAAGGLAGIKPTQKRNVRNIHDVTYFLGHLGDKESAILLEIEKLTNETNILERKMNSDEKTKTVEETLVSEIRGLEDDLADYNLTLDRIRNGHDPDDLLISQQQLKVKNVKVSKEIDNMLLSKMRYQKEVVNLEEEIMNSKSNITDVLKCKDIKRLDIFLKLMEDMRNLDAERDAYENEIELLRSEIGKIQPLMDRSEMNEDRNRCVALSEKMKNLEISLADIEEDIKILSMDPNVAHTYLLQKVKSDKEKTKDVDQKYKKILAEIDILEKAKYDLEASIQSGEERSEIGYYEELKKEYDFLLKNEGQITVNIDEANDVLAGLKGEQINKQMTIVTYLEEISQASTSKSAELPSQQEFKDLKDSMSFKDKHLANSKATAERLQEQKLKRIKELETVENLEINIHKEMVKLKEKMETMKSEMMKFDDLDELQERAEITKDYLVQMKDRYTERRNFLRSQVHDLSVKYNIQKEKLEHNDVWKLLSELEETIRQQCETVFSLREATKVMALKTDYNAMKKSCLFLVSKINNTKLSYEQ